MANEAVSWGLTREVGEREPERKIYGVTVATVLNNIDCNGQARVQLQLPWLPGYQPWARLACQMAGMGRGTYFVPQIGEEVLVSFNHGDVREPYVLGSLWNTVDRPPAASPTDAINKRKIRTPLGHELEFDDALQKVTLTTSVMTTVTLDATKAEISTPTASVTLGIAGDVKVTSKTRISLEAPIVEIKATAKLGLSASGSATLEGGQGCVIRGSTVKIN